MYSDNLPLSVSRKQQGQRGQKTGGGLEGEAITAWIWSRAGAFSQLDADLDAAAAHSKSYVTQDNSPRLKSTACDRSPPL
jgi:hypothetical protein